MIDIGVIIHPVVQLYELMLAQQIMIYGQTVSLGSIVMWVIVGSVFLHYFRMWIDV